MSCCSSIATLQHGFLPPIAKSRACRLGAQAVEGQHTSKALACLRDEVAATQPKAAQLRRLAACLMCRSSSQLREHAEWPGAGAASRARVLVSLEVGGFCSDPTCSRPAAPRTADGPALLIGESHGGLVVCWLGASEIQRGQSSQVMQLCQLSGASSTSQANIWCKGLM